MGCLYSIISPSGKKYIGITSQSIDIRWIEHCQRAREGRPHALHCALRKYNYTGFSKEILFESSDWNLLCDLEREAILKHNTLTPNGYNLTIGGEGTPGRIITEAQRKKMSEGQKKRFERPEERDKALAASKKGSKISGDKRRGIFWSERENLKRARKGGWYLKSDEHKEAHSRLMKEVMNRPEVKAKTIECAKKRASNPEWRKKMSESKKGQRLGVKRTEEQKMKQSESMKRKWAERKELIINPL